MFRSVAAAGLLAVSLSACENPAPSDAGATTETSEAPAPTTFVDEDGETIVQAPPSDSCTGSAVASEHFAGVWETGTGAARFGQHTVTEGENTVRLAAGSSGLNLTIDGFPTIRMHRTSRGEADWAWPRAENVETTPDDILVVLGCENQQAFARFVGRARVEAEGGASALAEFRLLMYTADEGLIYWRMDPPMESQGLFTISRAS